MNVRSKNFRFPIGDLRLKNDLQFANSSPIANRHAAANGFSLIELLVVMGIIILLTALALPAFNFISGSRSVEAASNQLSAILGIARQDAIGIQQDRGVVVFHDASTGND